MKPVENIAAAPIFFDPLSCRDEMAIIGSTKMYVSRTRLNEEVGTQRSMALRYLGLANVSAQDCPGAGRVKTSWVIPTEM